MLQAALGLPTRRSAEVAPYDLASLRPGGATRLLHQFEDAEFVRRRGRWLSSRVCEIDLQEVAVVTHQTRISATARSRISELVKAYLEIVEKTIRMLDSFIPLSAWPHLWWTSLSGQYGRSGADEFHHNAMNNMAQSSYALRCEKECGSLAHVRLNACMKHPSQASPAPPCFACSVTTHGAFHQNNAMNNMAQSSYALGCEKECGSRLIYIPN